MPSPSSRFMSRLPVTLASGASTTISHNINVQGVSTAPQIVQPDRNTSIVVTTVSATEITFTNSGTGDATAIFWCWYHHSITATPSNTSPGIFWKGGGGGGSYGGASRRYYILKGGTDDPSMGVFATIGSAMTWLRDNVADSVVVELDLSPTIFGERHEFDASGWVVNSEREVIIKGGVDSYNYTVRMGTVTLPDTNFYPNLYFVGCQVEQTAGTTFTPGATRAIWVENVRWEGTVTSFIDFNDGGISATGDSIFNTMQCKSTSGVGYYANLFDTLISIPQNSTFCTNCQLGAVIFDCRFNTAMTDAAATSALLVTTATTAFALTQCELTVNHGAAAGAATLFQAPAGATITYNDFVIVPTVAGASLVTLNSAAATVSSPVGVSTYPSTSVPMVLPTGSVVLAPTSFAQFAAAPAFDALVTVPTTGRSRHVFGEIELTPAAGDAASVNIQVETAIGSGAYQNVITLEIGAGLIQTFKQNFSFTVTAGRRYKFHNASGVTANAQINVYNYVDNP